MLIEWIRLIEIEKFDAYRVVSDARQRQEGLGVKGFHFFVRKAGAVSDHLTVNLLVERYVFTLIVGWVQENHILVASPVQIFDSLGHLLLELGFVDVGLSQIRDVLLSEFTESLVAIVSDCVADDITNREDSPRTFLGLDLNATAKVVSQLD